MSAPRSSMISILKEKFATPETKAHCIASSLHCLRTKNYKRVFDKFPDFLPLAKLSSWSERLLAILKEASPESSEKKVDLSHSLTPIEKLQQDIAANACTDLLDAKGNIKRELIELLGWEREAVMTSQNKELSLAIVQAYMQFATTLVATHQKIPVENQRAAVLVFSIMSTRYGTLVREAVDHHINKVKSNLTMLGVGAVAAGLLLWGVKSLSDGSVPSSLPAIELKNFRL